MELMESYAKELKNENFLSRFGQARHSVQVSAPESNPVYVGSEKCKKCHEGAYDVWKQSTHSHAYQTLVDAKEPSLRHFDPECIVCHTVGFGFQSGFSTFEKHQILRMLAAKVAMAHRANMSKNRMTKCGISS